MSNQKIIATDICNLNRVSDLECSVSASENSRKVSLSQTWHFSESNINFLHQDQASAEALLQPVELLSDVSQFL